MKTCYIYIRSAIQHPLGDKTFNSIEIQKSQCLDYAKKHKYQVLKIFYDNGASGNSLNREGLKQLLEQLKKHPADAVIISRIDRLSRKIALFSRICKTIRDIGVEIISVTEGSFDSNNLMQDIIISVAKYGAGKEKYK